MLERVVAHIAAADAHGAGQRVIKARDEIYKRGFALAGAADDADGLTAVDMYGDVAQCKLVRVAGITEADVFKIHTPVGHDGVTRPVRDVNGLVEHLIDADEGGMCAGQSHNEPREHRQSVDGLRRVGHQTDKLTCKQARCAENDLAAAEEQQHDRAAP